MMDSNSYNVVVIRGGHLVWFE